jgi:hypothetical protein
VLIAIPGNGYLEISWKMIPSPLSGPGSEAKEKCHKGQTLGKDQSEAIRKRPHCLTQKMHFLMPHFLDHSVLLRSIPVTQFLTEHCLCYW